MYLENIVDSQTPWRWKCLVEQVTKRANRKTQTLYGKIKSRSEVAGVEDIRLQKPQPLPQCVVDELLTIATGLHVHMWHKISAISLCPFVHNKVCKGRLTLLWNHYAVKLDVSQTLTLSVSTNKHRLMGGVTSGFGQQQFSPLTEWALFK